ncbi:hypothetical protein AB0M46_39370 [Dactylosporangium sp. NPDC051485]|uniref:hypothetical protein n=1 Tax=Dactylosporangium sp. NPDC051485 TaxID=3154846 RepID=UPI00342487F8
MSYLEKRAWIYGIVAIVVPVAYAVVLLARRPAAGLADTHYAGPMLVAVGAAILLNIAAGSLVGGPVRRDERDKAIGRLGEYAGFYVMSIAAVVPLVLAMREAPYFWVANALYLALSLAALVSSAVKIVAYRRGF